MFWCTLVYSVVRHNNCRCLLCQVLLSLSLPLSLISYTHHLGGVEGWAAWHGMPTCLHWQTPATSRSQRMTWLLMAGGCACVAGRDFMPSFSNFPVTSPANPSTWHFRGWTVFCLSFLPCPSKTPLSAWRTGQTGGWRRQTVSWTDTPAIWGGVT